MRRGACSARRSTGSRPRARSRSWPRCAATSGTGTSSSSSSASARSRPCSLRRATRAATPTSAGTRGATRSSTRSSASTGCPTGTRGRSRSSGSGRSGRATTPPPVSAPPGSSTTARSSRSASPSASTAPTSTRPTWSSRPTARGFRANGGKYYIGNGNVAGMVSVFGRRADVEGPDGYVFFAADSAHPAYKLRKNVVHAQMYVERLRPRGLPRRARGHPAQRRRRVRGGAQHDQRRQVQPRLLRDRHGRALLLRDGHPGREPGSVRQARDRVPADSEDPHGGLRATARDEALRRRARSTTSAARAWRTAATSSTRRSTRCA